MTNRSLLEGNHRHTQHHMCTNAIKAQYIIVFAHFYTRSKCLTLVVAERERHTDTDCIRNGLSKVRSGRELVISTWPSLICFPFTARPTDERMLGVRTFRSLVSSLYAYLFACVRVCGGVWDRRACDVINLWSMKFNQTIPGCWWKSVQVLLSATIGNVWHNHEGKLHLVGVFFINTLMRDDASGVTSNHYWLYREFYFKNTTFGATKKMVINWLKNIWTHRVYRRHIWL